MWNECGKNTIVLIVGGDAKHETRPHLGHHPKIDRHTSPRFGIVAMGLFHIQCLEQIVGEVDERVIR